MEATRYSSLRNNFNCWCVVTWFSVQHCLQRCVSLTKFVMTIEKTTQMLIKKLITIVVEVKHPFILLAIVPSDLLMCCQWVITYLNMLFIYPREVKLWSLSLKTACDRPWFKFVDDHLRSSLLIFRSSKALSL